MAGAKPVERIGHRGAPREFAENTLPSFQRAFERGADAVELDVHATADGVVVVHHDPVVGTRVAPADLRGRAIAELTWAELQSVEIVSAEPRTSIPTLAAVLAGVPASGKVYVEIKGMDIESAVAAVIRKSAVRCAVHSFDHGAIMRMQDIAPDIPRGILFDAYPDDVAEAIARAGAVDVWPERRLIDTPLVDAVHAAGGRVIAWTVNAPEDVSRLAGLGVDSLCSDDVRLLV